MECDLAIWVKTSAERSRPEGKGVTDEHAREFLGGSLLSVSEHMDYDISAFLYQCQDLRGVANGNSLGTEHREEEGDWQQNHRYD
jgi:hypothetical protein